MSTKLTRRSFLTRTALAGAALSLPARTYSQAPGSNDDIRVGVVGFKGRGQSHISAYLGMKGVRIVALCDVDSAVLENGVKQLQQKNLEVKPYKDIRQMLDSGEVDVVSIATPNHWHALGAIWAIQAGKDVYVEKPVSHNVWEGRQLVKAAEKYDKIVQMGVQSRSAKGLQDVLGWMKTEPLGKLKWVRGLCYKRRPSIGLVTGDTPIPETIDYDLWSGPAPIVPPHRTRIHYDWHWIWNYGNGDLGNQGIHQMDIARRFTGEMALSPAVWSIGGRLSYKDDGETPNSQIVFHDYAKAPLIFEVRGLPDKSDSKEMDKYRGAGVGVVAQYENGYVVAPDYANAAVFDNEDKLVRRYGKPSMGKDLVESNPLKAEKPPEAAEVEKPVDKEEGHFGNFINCVRSRKSADLNGKIIDGHISSALCHTANISYRLGQTSTPGEMREKLKGNPAALDSLNRLATHLEANGVDLNVEKLTMGEFLQMDPKTEKFIKNPAADKQLTRQYRAPYIVPEKV